MGGLRNARNIGCGEGDHVGNGCWNSGGKQMTPSTCGRKPDGWDSRCEWQRFSTVSRSGRRGAKKRRGCWAQELADGVAGEKSG
jgi:hypothetical protein